MNIYICIVSIIIIILNIYLLFNQLAIPLPLTPQMGGWAPKSRGVPPSAFPPKEGAPCGPLEVMHNVALSSSLYLCLPRSCGGGTGAIHHCFHSRLYAMTCRLDKFSLRPMLADSPNWRVTFILYTIINVRLYLLYTDVSCDKIYLYIHSYLYIFHLFNFINRLIQNRVISTNK